MKNMFDAAAALVMKIRGRHPSQMWGRVFDLSKKHLVDLQDYSMYIMPDDYVGSMILKDKIYEPHVTNVVKSILKEGDVFLDLGANLGYFSLLASRLVTNTGKVIAFEPNPQNQQLILTSILKNEASNVNLYPYAVSNTSCILRFTTVGSNGGVVTAFSQDQRHYLLVQAVVLDEILYREPRIDVVKIDIEAHEPSALRGMKALISKHKPTIITEFHPWAMQLNNPEAPVEYLRQIHDLGYKISVIEPSGNMLHFSSEEQVMNYWRSLNQETIHLDLLAQPM